MLEEKLEKRRAKKMEKLQQKHENENKVLWRIKASFIYSWQNTPTVRMLFIGCLLIFQRIKIENVDGATEEVDLLKKQEMEKQQLIENDANMENEIEQVYFKSFATIKLVTPVR